MSTEIHIISNNVELHSDIISKLEKENYTFLEKYSDKATNGKKHILIFHKEIFDINLEKLKTNIKKELDSIILNLYSDIEIKVSY
ncbi:hypothetical protein [Mannheimia varigena]|uniref:hypothetical protein n=1 Tax=Mannheimia varigena TaxID=85404 RepID=UPI0015B52860|nr:hypothetical protein [Mannheimia varigena]QLD33563.1 hypothetical protein A6B42_07170 [Mannheimia varigena]